MSDDLYQKKFRVPSARYIAHDYNHGMYFITVCSAAHEHYFGKITNGEMELNALGEYLLQNLQNVSLHYPYAEIPLFVIMPNHIHAIVIINDAPSRRDGACPVSNINDAPPRKDGACPVSNENGGRPVSESRVSDGQLRFASHRDEARLVSTGDETAQSILNEIEIKQKMMRVSHQKGLLSITIGGLKSAITKYANTNKITFGWQTRFYDRIIRDQDECNQIAIYIEQNPAKWEIDKHKI
jgi:putative transposase